MTIRVRAKSAAASVLLLSVLVSSGTLAQPASGHAENDEGVRVFKSANCVGCHKWTGSGGGGYGGAAANLRQTALTRDQIIETIRCGRPGAGMPYFERDAYANGACYGLKKADLPSGQMPPEPDHYLRPKEIDAVADYVLTHFKGKGDPTFAECQAFFGTGTRVCDTYGKEKGTSPTAMAQSGHAHMKVEAAGDANASGASRDTEPNDLREFRVGMPVAELPATGYRDFSCTDAPERTLSGWSEYGKCPVGPAGFHSVSFRYDDNANQLARINEDARGTKIAGQPVLVALLIGDDARVDGLRIETDPQARLYAYKKAFLFGQQVKARYGQEGWVCTDAQPSADEQPVGGVFVKEHCEKTTATRRLVLDRQLFRHAGEDLKKFTDGTQLTILARATP